MRISDWSSDVCSSDLWPTMAHAVHILEQFDIAHEVRIVSAHRTPDRLVDYAKSAAQRGLRAIVAGAGGAAHLRSEEHTSDLQSLMRISYAVFCLKKNNHHDRTHEYTS